MQLTHRELVKRGFFGSCRRRHTAHETSIRLGGHIGGLTSVEKGADASSQRFQCQGYRLTAQERNEATAVWILTLVQLLLHESYTAQ